MAFVKAVINPRVPYKHKTSQLMNTNCLRFEVFTAVTMKNAVAWDVMSCGSCKNRVSEELSASIIRVTRIGELGTTLAYETSFLQEPHGITSQKTAFCLNKILCSTWYRYLIPTTCRLVELNLSL
jgi:hypothetical protein